MKTLANGFPKKNVRQFDPADELAIANYMSEEFYYLDTQIKRRVKKHGDWDYVGELENS